MLLPPPRILAHLNEKLLIVHAVRGWMRRVRDDAFSTPKVRGLFGVGVERGFVISDFLVRCSKIICAWSDLHSVLLHVPDVYSWSGVALCQFGLGGMDSRFEQTCRPKDHHDYWLLLHRMGSDDDTLQA